MHKLHATQCDGVDNAIYYPVPYYTMYIPVPVGFLWGKCSAEIPIPDVDF